MNDGNYRLEDYGIDGQGGEGDGIGLVGVSGGANGDFHVDLGISIIIELEYVS